MEVYIALQVLIVSSCLFEFYNDRKTKFRILSLLCVVVALFGGLRWKTGNDWDQFFWHFCYSNWNNIFNYVRYQTGENVERLESGFVFINILIKSVFKTFFWYNIIICLFIQYSCYKFIRYHCPERPLLLYATIHISAFLYFPVRAGLAVGICYWAYRFIKERELWKFLLVITLASSIHNQCVILFPLYWIGYIKPKWYYYLISFLIVYVTGTIFQDYIRPLSMLFGGEIGDKFQNYAEKEATEGFASIGILNVFLHFCLLSTYLYMAKMKCLGKNIWAYTLINCYFLYNCIGFVFLEGMGDLSRLRDPLAITASILYIYAITFFIKSRINIVRIGAIVFFVFYLMKQFLSLGQGYYFKETCIPYRTIFDYNLTLW